MYITLLVIFLFISIALISIIILQCKATDFGVSFGSGASSTLFGSSGTGHFMTKMTAIFAALFFSISLILGNLTANKSITGGKWENIDEPTQADQPALVPIIPSAPTSDIPY
ncbi:MAG: preprotein translocase subunit SecG [Candidatus Arsenophonus melophagi]|nr:preprotein translocase subunit SecG [Candidatus Arsenophonus melophagi]